MTFLSSRRECGASAAGVYEHASDMFCNVPDEEGEQNNKSTHLQCIGIPTHLIFETYKHLFRRAAQITQQDVRFDMFALRMHTERERARERERESVSDLADFILTSH